MEIEQLRPSKAQSPILEKAIELLRKYDEGGISYTMCYFTDKDGNEIYGYNCCGCDDCVKIAKKNIRKESGSRRIINEHHICNDGEHEGFERCSVCGTYLNSSLTWVRHEFYEAGNCYVDKEDFKRSEVAFELKTIYESLEWNLDYAVSGYVKHQYQLGNEKPLKEALKRQQALIDDIVKHAKLVIDALESEENEFDAEKERE